MEVRHDAASHVLCVVSDDYLKETNFYSQLERRAALWQAAGKRPGFALLVVVKPCRLPTLSDHYRHCELFDVPEDAARLRFREFMQNREAPETVAFPGQVFAVSNIPIRVPTHFMGRDDALAAIEAGLGRYDGRVAITALHGLRGVGKTVLATAYAELHRVDYRATWWIRAQSESAMRADLVALGVRLRWAPPDEKEEPALASVMERLRHEGEGILLIFDNAADADALKPYLPRGGAVRVLVTSNAPAWRGLAEPVEIQLWPKETGADYLIARTGREAEREAAEDLSEVLGGLPLAHEQAAAYCERLEIPLGEYHRRFAAAPVQMLDSLRDAPTEYHDKLTVAKTFTLAIDEATKRHPAAEPLIVHAALLAPEPIPLFLFAKARKKFGEPLASAFAGDGLDKAVAVLRAFAVIDRETIVDERDPTFATETIRLHRLVREIAAARRSDEAQEGVRRALVEVLAAVYPTEVYKDPVTWPRARRLDALPLALLGDDVTLRGRTALSATYLLNQLAAYRYKALGAYVFARPLYELALAVREEVLGLEHPATVISLNNLADLLQAQGDLAAAQALYERAFRANEKLLGSDHPNTATSLNNLAGVLWAKNEVAVALPLSERALAIRENALGAEHPLTASSLNNFASLLQAQGNFAAARPLFERALAIRERVLGSDHPDVAQSLNNLAGVLQVQGEPAAARPLLDRALAINEKMLGPDHPAISTSLNSLGALLVDQGDLAAAQPLIERALVIREKALGPAHPDIAVSLNNLASVFRRRVDYAAAQPLFERALAIREKVLGPEHPDTATSLNNLAGLLRDQGDFAAARSLYERALTIYERACGPDHPNTALSLANLASLLQAQGDLAGARPLYERSLAIYEKTLGSDHPDTAMVRGNLASLGWGIGS
jgi:tetratricopeptide (TPR) repeat protein